MSFSIITTVLNNEKFILSCLQSLKDQTINKNEIEHIIVDGGSTDNTVNIIRNFKKKNNYVKLFIKKKTSIYEAINFGLKKANKNYIALLHSDDYIKNIDTLKIIKKIFNSDKKIDAVYSNIIFIDRNNKNTIKRIFTSRQLSYKDYLRGEHPPHTTLILKKKIYQKYANYNTSFKIASDFEFMLRIFGVLRVKARYLNKQFIIMRTGGASTKSLKNIFLSNIEAYRSFKLHNVNYKLYYIFLKIFRKIKQIR